MGYIPGQSQAMKRWPEFSSRELMMICFEANDLAINTEPGNEYLRGKHLSIFSWALAFPQYVEAVRVKRLLMPVNAPETILVSNPRRMGQVYQEWIDEYQEWIDEYQEPTQDRTPQGISPEVLGKRGSKWRR